MKFRIPFTLAGIESLKKKSSKFEFLDWISKKNRSLEQHLKNADIKITGEEYLRISARTLSFTIILTYIISSLVLFIFKIQLAFLMAIPLSILASSFVMFRQLIYPKIYDSRRVKNIEKNLIPSLEDMHVQLNSGIPLYNIMVNVSSSDYGYLSEEFKKIVKKINAGLPEMEVLEEMGEQNSSIFLKRTLWQISNGMKAGSDLSIVIKESIKSLNEEQILQIQNYGNKLNPLIMFYMIISVILPALSIAFLTIISSMINLSTTTTKMMFFGLFLFVILIQIMFLGTIKSIRPSLL